MKSLRKKIVIILALCSILSVLVFFVDYMNKKADPVITRNPYGEGDKTEEYEVIVEGELENESFQVEIGEREYNRSETRELFRQVMDKLDEVVLGENESFDRVEKDMNLVTRLEDYPVQIQWELDSYHEMNVTGKLREENLVHTGSMVEIRGTISYGEEQAVYIRSAYLYPLTREGTDKLIYEIEQAIAEVEESTREKENFSLPERVAGKELQWSKKTENRWYYFLLIGVGVSVFLVYHSKEKVKQKEKARREELIRDYPGMISKFTMLLGTGTTVKHAWETIVQNYEMQKEQMGKRIVYEEMRATLHEMQGGVSEVEAYERFGKRCGITVYLKFSALLSQNLRKGSKGISELLRMEAIQSFENRKNRAKRMGEEAGTKLLMPMLGMLAVVMIMVMIPAFMTMQF